MKIRMLYLCFSYTADAIPIQFYDYTTLIRFPLCSLHNNPMI